MRNHTTTTTKLDMQAKQSPRNRRSVLAQESRKRVRLVRERERLGI